MYSLLEQYVGNIATLTSRFGESHSHHTKRRALGMHLWFRVLKQAYDDLENIYYHYALKPQLQTTQPLVISCLMCMQHFLVQKAQMEANLSRLN